MFEMLILFFPLTLTVEEEKVELSAAPPLPTSTVPSSGNSDTSASSKPSASGSSEKSDSNKLSSSSGSTKKSATDSAKESDSAAVASGDKVKPATADAASPSSPSSSTDAKEPSASASTKSSEKSQKDNDKLEVVKEKVDKHGTSKVAGANNAEEKKEEVELFDKANYIEVLEASKFDQVEKFPRGHHYVQVNYAITCYRNVALYFFCACLHDSTAFLKSFVNETFSVSAK